MCDLENLKNEEAIARDWAARAIEKKIGLLIYAFSTMHGAYNVKLVKHVMNFVSFKYGYNYNLRPKDNLRRSHKRFPNSYLPDVPAIPPLESNRGSSVFGVN